MVMSAANIKVTHCIMNPHHEKQIGRQKDKARKGTNLSQCRKITRGF